MLRIFYGWFLCGSLSFPITGSILVIAPQASHPKDKMLSVYLLSHFYLLYQRGRSFIEAPIRYLYRSYK